jgi:hypothetical protein
MPGTGAGRAWAFFSYQGRNALDAKTAYWFPRRSLNVLIPSSANLTSHILVCGFGHKGNRGAPARSYSFQNRDVVRRKGNERVDIVVNCGFAFVP